MAINLRSIKLTKQQQQLIVAVVLGLGGFGYIYVAFFWMPISASIEENSKKIEEIEGKIDNAKQVAARLPRLEMELKALNDKEAEAERRLPKDKDVPDILVTVGELAQENNITLQSFTPGPAAAKPFFVELSYPITVQGNFHNIGKFLAALSLEERLFNVQNVTYGAEDASGVMVVNFTLVSYQYKG